MSVRSTRALEPATGSVARLRWRRVAPADLLAVAALVVVAGLVELYLHRLLSRPFYYDEAWRAYEITLGHGFLAHLQAAPAPVAFGWWAIEDAARHVLGNTEAGLRAPMFAVLPLLGIATYLLGRRWLPAWASFAAAAFLLLNGWIVNYALQLKSYTFDGLLAVVALGLYLAVQRTGRHPAQLLGLYALLGVTCVLSLPNLFVVGPLLAFDLVRVVRTRDQRIARLAGIALAGVIALVHYLTFVAPQAGVADEGFFVPNYAPHQVGAFLSFAGHGFQSYLPSMVVGIEGGALNAAPVYHLAAFPADLLAAILLVLLVAGVESAVRDAAGRALVVAVAGILVLELVASALHRWPFGLLRVNIFVLPLLYLLAAIGVARLVGLIRGMSRAGDPTRHRLREPAYLGQHAHATRSVPPWRAGIWPALGAVGLVVTAVAVIGATVVAGIATSGSLQGSDTLSARPIWWAATKDAAALVRQTGSPRDLVIIRSDRSPAGWYADPWLYYMYDYQGFPRSAGARTRIPASQTISVPLVSHLALRDFMAAHGGSRTVFLVEYDGPRAAFPASGHEQSLRTLLKYGYCPVREIPLTFTGAMTVLTNTGCHAP